MTQAFSGYISKAISGPANLNTLGHTLELILDLILNLEQQKYVTIRNKATTTQYLMSVICSMIQWRTCSIFMKYQEVL